MKMRFFVCVCKKCELCKHSLLCSNKTHETQGLNINMTSGMKSHVLTKKIYTGRTVNFSKQPPTICK